ETTIAVRYIQRLYEVVVAPPQTPSSFFTGAFSQQKLEQQVNLGRLGPDNQPVYVSNIVYGRMMMFTMTAEASSSELKAIVNASYDGLVGGASASLSARQQEVLSSSRIAITTYGGDRNGTQAMIRSGDWREYFTQTVRLSDALPLSYTFKTLTGQIAGVSESTNYNIKTCQPLEDSPFLYRSVQQIGQPVPTPFTRRMADVTGDGRADLILNHLSPTRNVVAVLPGMIGGTFGAAVVSEAAGAPAGGWAEFEFVVGDVTDNGRADMVWSRQDNTGNLNYVGLSAATGAVTFQAPFNVGSTSWSPVYRTFLADINRDGAKDLVWNFLGTQNFTWRALSNRDGTFNTAAAAGQTHPSSGWSSYEAFIGDVDRDGDEDIIWNSRNDGPNRFYVGIADSVGSFTFPTPGRDHPTTCCWTPYQRIVGDFDGDLRADIAQFINIPSTRGLHRAYSNGVNAFTFPAYASDPLWRANVPYVSTFWEPYTGDVNGDGVDDVILNTFTGGNVVRVAFGTTARTFPPPAIQPNHPASAQWSSTGNRGLLVGDVDGDGRDDIVWVVAGAVTEVYVGSGRP
ncbi:MAG: VCBS repeat-containing protein, partial [Gemmatimonadaceae bacterium]|nr:VCBS repeat-containing protein [Gemmatimonadaceae bacterium]